MGRRTRAEGEEANSRAKLGDPPQIFLGGIGRGGKIFLSPTLKGSCANFAPQTR